MKHKTKFYFFKHVKILSILMSGLEVAQKCIHFDQTQNVPRIRSIVEDIIFLGVAQK